MSLLAVVASCRRGPEVEQRREGRFGDLRIYSAPTAPHDLVFVFSDAGGWDTALDGTAREVAEHGAVVVGVDLPSYQRGLAASGDGCHYVLSEVEDLSKRLQRERGFAGYQPPILAGIGAGGTLAYAALAQSPAATVSGAVSVDPAPALLTTVPLCSGAPSHAAAGSGYSYGAKHPLPGWWQVSPPDSVPPPLRALATPAASPGAAAERLAALLDADLAPPAPSRTALADLPIVELPSKTPGSIMAVFYSGDGGWRDLDKTIGEALARDGVPVIGIDSLRYFWRAKTPEQIATDLTRIVQHYSAAWSTPHVVLIGYSFGAGVIPFAYNRLPDDVRAHVVQVSLLGIEPRALFEFKVTGWLRAAPADAAPVLPEVARFPPDLLQCVYGTDEPETLCRDPALSGAELIHTKGGHHFDGNYQALAREILAGARRRTNGKHR